MSKQTKSRKSTGSPEGSSHAIPPQTGLASVGQQSVAGLLTRKQLAQRWNVCSHTIARRTDLRPVRLGKRLLRYRLSDIEALEAAAAGRKGGA